MVTPEGLAKSGSEEAHQTAFFAWAANPLTTAIERLKTNPHPSLAAMYAIPNGGERNKIVASKLKAQGVKAGVWDIHLPVPTKAAIGLWIEFKKRPNGLTNEQKEFRESLKSYGFDWFVAYTWVEAAEKILQYLGATPR